MYGVNGELARRMQRRLRQKIYREMIEQQAAYKRQKEDDNYLPHHQVKTEPDYDHTRYSKQWHPKPPKYLEHQSTFLPVINQHQLRYSQPQHKAEQNSAYQQYLNKRNKPNKYSQQVRNSEAGYEDVKSQETIEIGNIQTGEEDDLNEEKTKIYLEQCEQIINNLKLLTGKNSKKAKPRSSKYDIDKTFIKRKPNLTKSFNFEKEFSQRVSPVTPNLNNSFASPSESFSRVRKEKTQSYSINSLRQPEKEEKMNKAVAMSQSLNEFNEFSYPMMKKSSSGDGKTAKQNHRRIEPILKEKQPSQVGQPESDNIKELNFQKQSPSKTKDKAYRMNENHRELKLSTDQGSKPEKLQSRKKEIGRKAQSLPKEEDNQTDPQTIKKQQNAILRYLKKARACGNLLSQKVQGHKKPPEETNPN